MQSDYDPVRVLIRTQLNKLDLDMAEVSRAIGRNHAYLQQYFERGVPAQIPEALRQPLAKILKVQPHQLVGTPRPRLRKQPSSPDAMREPVAPQRAPQGFDLPETIPATERAHIKSIIDALARRDPDTVAFIAADMEVMAEVSLRNLRLSAFDRGGWISLIAGEAEDASKNETKGDQTDTPRKIPSK